jgi:hypothetical protein
LWDFNRRSISPDGIRQKEIVTDTDQLLELAQQLKTSVDKSKQDELSLNVMRQAVGIQKLTKQIEQKMRTETGVPD